IIPYCERLDGHNEEKLAKYESRISELTLPVSHTVKKLVWHTFPFLNWFLGYKVKTWLLGDLLSGLSVGLLTIPLSLAYGVIAGQPSINGLYTSLISTVLYCLLGTTPHMSYGASAFTALLIAKHVGHIESGELVSDSDCSPKCSMELHVVTLTCVSGIILILMGIFRLSFLQMYISKPVINGFKAGTAFNLIIILLTILLGIDGPIHHGPLAFVYTLKDIIENNEINIGSLIAGLATLAFLIPLKIINYNYSRHLFPIEFIVMAIAIGMTLWLDLEDNYNFKLINYQPFTAPQLVLPSLSLISSVIADAVSIALVTFVVSLSMGTEISKKHNHSYHPHRETLVLGFCDLILSFLGAFAVSGVCEQTVVQEKAWGQTQGAGLVAASLCLTALFCGQTLLPLVPKTVLGAIVIANLGCYLEFFRKYCFACRRNRYDFLAGIVTFAAVCLLGIDIGLAVGVFFSLLLTLHRLQRPSIAILGHIPNTETYTDLSFEKAAKEILGIKIIKTFDSVYYGNVDFFLAWLKRKVNSSLLPSGNSRTESATYSEEDKYNMLWESTQFLALDENALRQISRTALYRHRRSKHTANVHTVILDCGSISFIDDAGANALICLFEEYQCKGIDFVLASCSNAVLNGLREYDYFKTTRQTFTFNSVHDAVLYVLQQTTEQSHTLQGSECILETNGEDILTEYDTEDEIKIDVNSTNGEVWQREKNQRYSDQSLPWVAGNQRIIEYETTL
uniref:STAS domain-containing protein n=1 Tax=Callorhinchus milii TaxID=7868 RepID=A0A4W3JIR4_CALMI